LKIELWDITISLFEEFLCYISSKTKKKSSNQISRKYWQYLNPLTAMACARLGLAMHAASRPHTLGVTSTGSFITNSSIKIRNNVTSNVCHYKSGRQIFLPISSIHTSCVLKYAESIKEEFEKQEPEQPKVSILNNII
jgi:hypothetical protein